MPVVRISIGVIFFVDFFWVVFLVKEGSRVSGLKFWPSCPRLYLWGLLGCWNMSGSALGFCAFMGHGGRPFNPLLSLGVGDVFRVLGSSQAVKLWWTSFMLSVMAKVQHLPRYPLHEP